MLKILIPIIVASAAVLPGCGYKNTENKSLQEVSPEKPPVVEVERGLCEKESFTAPIEEELKYNEEIAKDEFVSYLRKALDNFLGEEYINCGGDDCNKRGLIDGEQYPDSAYQDLQKIDKSYLKSRFIVLETGIALGGGESIVLLFKDKPDKLFSAWVYDYKNDRGYDLRAIEKKYTGGTEIENIQKIYINQLCNDDFGI